ncbi:MAG: hypothetical protein PVH00_09475 [Gemmatimonadota bacterium]
MSKRLLLGFRWGSALWILTGLLHTIGYFMGNPEPASEEQATLFSLFYGLEIPMMGLRRTLGAVFDGLSLAFAILVLLLGFTGLIWLRTPAVPDGILRRVAGMNAVAALALLVIGLPRFPPPPLIAFAAVGTAFAVAAWPGRKTMSA